MTIAQNLYHLQNQTSFQTIPDQDKINVLRKLHPSDIAEILETQYQTPEETIDILIRIGNHVALETFEHLSSKAQQKCLETGNTRVMLRFIENMSPDDRVDLLKKVDTDIRESMMPLIAQAERNDIKYLWKFEEGTAGAEMTTEYVYFNETITVSKALENLRLFAPNKETIYYIYITDQTRTLLGVISLRDLIMARPQIRLAEIMQTNIISVSHDLHLENVAATISKYDLIALPVVDKENHLLGIITFDDVIDLVEAQSTREFHQISAVVPFEENYFNRPLFKLFWNRFFWLAILLFTSLLSTYILEFHESVMHKMIALAFFIPLVTGTCGNAGTQSATLMVRALALGEVTPRDILRVFKRELVMGVALGCALGVMTYFRVFLQDHNSLLGYIVAIALLATLLTANLAGAIIPLILKKINLDPALTAGPFIATIIDALGISIYFYTAIFLLNHFSGTM